MGQRGDLAAACDLYRQNVTSEMLAHYHELAHRECFIARSIRTKVSVQMLVASA